MARPKRTVSFRTAETPSVSQPQLQPQLSSSPISSPRRSAGKRGFVDVRASLERAVRSGPVESNLDGMLGLIEETGKSALENVFDLGMDLAEAGLMEELGQVAQSLLDTLKARQLAQERKAIFGSFKRGAMFPGNGEEASSAEEPLTSRMMQQWTEAEARTSNQTASQIFTRFREQCFEVVDGTETMPAIMQTQSQDSDDMIVMLPSRANLACPLTCVQLVDPVMNPSCRHTYSRAAIQEVMRNENVRTTRCPVPGCDAVVVSDRLVPNSDIVRLLERRATRVFD